MNWNDRVGGKKAERIPCPDGIEGCLVAHYKVIEEQTKQEQGEPVAWRTFDGEGGYDYRSFEDNENYKEDYIKRNGDKYKDWVETLYTTPQPRKPLTFEQVEDCFGEGATAEENGILISAQWLHDFARAIESAHGIKE